MRVSNNGWTDEFGYSVALSARGSTALAGAPFRNTGTGAAYVFTEGRGAYAIYMVGDSMEPRYFPGETVFIKRGVVHGSAG